MATAKLKLISPTDNVHIIKHIQTDTMFAVHKHVQGRSMTFIVAFVHRSMAADVKTRMETYKMNKAVWPNRIIEDGTGYLQELHSDKEGSLGELELTTTYIGKLQRVMHARNMAVELVYDTEVDPDLATEVTYTTPRKDYKNNLYLGTLENTLLLEEPPRLAEILNE
jgi:hypothetical protein